MVSAHPNWTDTPDGYARGCLGIFVEQTAVTRENGSSKSTTEDPDVDANPYSVSVRTGLRTDYGLNERLVAFAEPRVAWEYANLATHYLENTVHAEYGIVDLTGRNPQVDSWTPDGIVSELTAEETMRRMLGANDRRLDDALERVGAIEHE